MHAALSIGTADLSTEDQKLEDSLQGRHVGGQREILLHLTVAAQPLEDPCAATQLVSDWKGIKTSRLHTFVGVL